MEMYLLNKFWHSKDSMISCFHCQYIPGYCINLSSSSDSIKHGRKNMKHENMKKLEIKSWRPLSIFLPYIIVRDDLFCFQLATSTSSTLFNGRLQPWPVAYSANSWRNYAWQQQAEFICSKSVDGNARNSHFIFVTFKMKWLAWQLTGNN